MKYSKLDVLLFMEYAYGFITLGYVHDIFRFHSKIKNLIKIWWGIQIQYGCFIQNINK